MKLRTMTSHLWTVSLLIWASYACSSDDDKVSGGSTNTGGASGAGGVGGVGGVVNVAGSANVAGTANIAGSATTLVVLPCSTTNPTGSCEAGNSCIDGVCVVDAAVCSTTNPGGLCSTGHACYAGACVSCSVAVYTEQPVIAVDTKTKLTADGLQFKDSSGDGKLDPYEDWRLPEICRAKDLVTKMTIPQKVGLMSETSSIGSGTEDASITDAIKATLQTGHVRQALIRLGARSGQQLAAYMNAIQKICEADAWGIPFVVTTDPSHGFGMSTSDTTGAQSLSASTVLSPWPYPLGLGAINDLDVTRQFGDAVRQEFMAMGFRWELGPMADSATEPRWARVQNTFGENAYMVANHAKACIEGFQGLGKGGLKNGIAATVKHFPGAGADEHGKDSHSRAGKFNVFPGDNFIYHQIPFKAAIAAGAAALMPCYSIFKGQLDYEPEQTGTAFSHSLITGYLKQQLGFSGMVTSDWGTMSSTAWGVESLTQPQRAAMFVKAGSHQLGSDSYTIVQAAVDQGLLTEKEINGAAEKILEMSFKLGIFENPYVDPAAAATIIRSNENLTNGFVAQKKAIVMLKNRAHDAAPVSGYGADTATKYLPIRADSVLDTNGSGTVEIYFDGVVDGLAGEDIYSRVLGDYNYAVAAAGAAPGIASAAAAKDADIAILRITSRKGVYFGLDDGVPLSFDGAFPGISADSTIAASTKDRNKVIDLLRIRDGYTDSTGTAIPAANPKLKIVLVMHMDRPGIVEPFITGLKNLDETLGLPSSYPTVSDIANRSTTGLQGVDAMLVEFGAYDRAVLDFLFNKSVPTTPPGYAYGAARLPMEIPRSDKEVNEQYEDVPADTWNPTFALGAGSTY